LIQNYRTDFEIPAVKSEARLFGMSNIQYDSQVQGIDFVVPRFDFNIFQIGSKYTQMIEKSEQELIDYNMFYLFAKCTF